MNKEERINKIIIELKSQNNLCFNVIKRNDDLWLQYINIETAEIVLERLLINKAISG